MHACIHTCTYPEPPKPKTQNPKPQAVKPEDLRLSLKLACLETPRAAHACLVNTLREIISIAITWELQKMVWEIGFRA